MRVRVCVIVCTVHVFMFTLTQKLLTAVSMFPKNFGFLIAPGSHYPCYLTALELLALSFPDRFQGREVLSLAKIYQAWD